MDILANVRILWEPLEKIAGWVMKSWMDGGHLMLLAVNRLLVACNAIARAKKKQSLFLCLNSNTGSIVVVVVQHIILSKF